MASKKTTTPAKSVKAAPAKKATVTSKAVPAKKAAPASAKKAVAPTKKVAAPAKKAAPVKKVAAPVKKAAPAKKAVAPAKKVAAPAKKAAPAKAVATPKKAAAPAKAVVPAKKAVVAKKEVAAPAKKVVAAKPAPAPKAVIKKAEPAKPVAPLKPLPKVEAKKPAPVKAAAKKEEKPMPIIAHRKIQKAAPKEQEGVLDKFNPQTRSVLDMPEQTTGPAFRYSDEDLAEFKELILKRIEAARDNLSYYQNLISRKDEMGDDSDNRLNSMEDGSGAMEKEQLSMMAARQVQFVNNLEKALVRIENKTYGICRETGKLIDKARLRAVPHATLSIEAKTSMKK